jgi:hypothetical protein
MLCSSARSIDAISSCTPFLSVRFLPPIQVHEATVEDQQWERARMSQHSTPSQAGRFAHECGVHHLALTHFSGRYNPHEGPGGVTELVAQAKVPCTPLFAPRLESSAGIHVLHVLCACTLLTCSLSHTSTARIQEQRCDSRCRLHGSESSVEGGG